MLSIDIVTVEEWDEENLKFVPPTEVHLEIEHSLVSLAKWESHWEKPLLGPGDRTLEETLWYIRAMTLTPNVPSEIYGKLSADTLVAIDNYVNRKMTATWFKEQSKKGPSGEVITAEIIYYWMIAMDVPFECQYWHLNRLLTLIRVVNEKSAPKKKMNRREQLEQQAMLNEKRRAQLNTRG